MQLSAINWVTCFTNDLLYPVKWDGMLVKASRVCTFPGHERDLFRSISQTPDMLELSFFSFSGVLYLDRPNKNSSRGQKT